jgi:hypothetical protein
MKKFDKAIILLIGVGIFFNFLKDHFYQKKRNEIVIAGHRVDKQPCISGINELFGHGVDSTKTCDCLLPRFYHLIKDDSEKVKTFEEEGFFTLQGKANDSATQIFRDCLVDNIVDTSYKLNIQKFREPFLQKLKDSLRVLSVLSDVSIDSVSNCVMQSVDGNITIWEYFAEDYLQSENLRSIMKECFGQFSNKD